MTQIKQSSVLMKCRDILAKRMGISVYNTLNDVEQSFYDMASSESNAEKANSYYKAVRKIKIKKRNIRERFEKKFITIFDCASNQIMEEKYDNAQSNIEYYPFIKDRHMDDFLLIENSIDKIKNSFTNALYHLDKKINNILKDVNIDEQNSPLKAETVYVAFWESCRDLKLENKHKQLLIGVFERYALLDLCQVYEELNNYLQKEVSNNKHGK